MHDFSSCMYVLCTILIYFCLQIFDLKSRIFSLVSFAKKKKITIKNFSSQILIPSMYYMPGLLNYPAKKLKRYMLADLYFDEFLAFFRKITYVFSFTIIFSDSCRSGRSNRGPQGVENDWKKRNCFCDNACAVYGDCCIDAKAYVQAEQQVNHLTFECANLKQYGDIYMKKKCASNWIDDIASAGQDRY